MQWRSQVVGQTEAIVHDACLVLGNPVVTADGVRHDVFLCGLTLARSGERRTWPQGVRLEEGRDVHQGCAAGVPWW